MMGYAKHKSMSIFVLDPQGEFARDMKDESSVNKVLKEKLSRNVEVFDLHRLVLTGWNLLKRVLINSGFFEKLGIYHETNRMQAADQIEIILRARTRGRQASLTQKIPPYNAHTREAFDRVWNAFQTD
jgi:hypothetical protein